MTSGGGFGVLMQAASLVVVGAFWGCTNPLLLRGSNEVASSGKKDCHPREAERPTLLEQLTKFRYVAVWLPYVLNQCGSLVFYLTLSQTGLSLAGPACNALALVFSVATSWYIGESIRRPVQTVIGAACVMVGVAICCASQQQ
jgi:Putative transmembrane family 234